MWAITFLAVLGITLHLVLVDPAAPGAGALEPTTNGTVQAEAISALEAIAIAKETIGTDDDAAVIPTTAAPAPVTSTAPPTGVVVKSTELTLVDAPAVTGGRDQLVWIVRLGGSTDEGIVSAKVYIAAHTGEVLTWVLEG